MTNEEFQTIVLEKLANIEKEQQEIKKEQLGMKKVSKLYLNKLLIKLV